MARSLLAAGVDAVSDLDAIRERHHLHVESDTCNVDGDGWPCDAAQALARVDELEAALDFHRIDELEAALDRSSRRVAELEAALRQWLDAEVMYVGDYFRKYGDDRGSDAGIIATTEALLARPEPKP